ncbi:MAG TPA: TetR/AcrR family transcriptional regulator [Candidatus Limiplasma sp.]|nr:TetR/AcrR family transcriptional regulator [Candidatus Limiplasma sp.]HPS80547.1 TetR/AcrR family transcriptional regulator [Candidatus Limiplasma sp.]
MAVSFSAKERSGIITALRRAATRHAAVVGMRKTTVDELALEAGISKGAFYKFYPSKEHLFLEVLEQWYQSILDKAAQALQANASLPPRQRTAMMLKAAWRTMREQQLLRFCQEEIPLMIRKLPENLLQAQYQSADEFVARLIARAGVKFTVTESEACASFRILFLSLLTASEVGMYYEKALDGLIDAACDQLIRND